MLYLQLQHGYPKIRFVELVRYIPAQRSKFPPLLYQTVEEAEPEQKVAPFAPLRAAIEKSRIRNGVRRIGSKQVLSQAFGSFVRHFDTLENKRK